jgi:hypothetical protein
LNLISVSRVQKRVAELAVLDFSIQWMEVDAPRASQPSSVIGHRQERSHLNEITWAHTGRMAADRISDKTSMKVKRRVGLGSEKSIVTFYRF